MTSGTIHEWYRFLDAHSDDEALCELRRLTSRLDMLHQELTKACLPLNYAPEDDLDEALRISRLSLSEAIEMLEEVVGRFRAGERHQIA